MISLDARLLACAEYVSGKGIACDVGTDHAYLATYLIESGRCNYVIASDINDGPLQSARRTIEKHEYQEKIALIKSDGLKKIDNNGITDVIIAGMGAETICQIIEDTKWLRSGVNLVLQPMTKEPTLRKWLYMNGFEILCEQAVIEDDYSYVIMRVGYTGIKKRIGSFMAYTGKLDFSKEQSKTYLGFKARRLMVQGEGLLNTPAGLKLGKRRIELANKIIEVIEGDKS